MLKKNNEIKSKLDQKDTAMLQQGDQNKSKITMLMIVGYELKDIHNS